MKTHDEQVADLRIEKERIEAQIKTLKAKKWEEEKERQRLAAIEWRKVDTERRIKAAEENNLPDDAAFAKAWDIASQERRDGGDCNDIEIYLERYVDLIRLARKPTPPPTPARQGR